MPKVRKAEMSFLYGIGHLVLFYISAKVRKAELSFLYYLVLFYISTKYEKNIPKGL